MKKWVNKSVELRSRNIPSGVLPHQWASAISWNIEVWKCVYSQQKWMHPITIVCPEQFELLLNENGQLIISDINLLRFASTAANAKWADKLKVTTQAMREKGEYTEAIYWSSILSKIQHQEVPTPNEDYVAKQKESLKGHRLIRIKRAA